MSRLIQSYSEKYQAIIEKAIEEHKRQEKQTKARIEELEEFNISLGIIDQALMNLSQELYIELKESRMSG